MPKTSNLCDSTVPWFSEGVTMIDCDPDWAVKHLSGDLSSKEAILASADAYFDAMLPHSKVTDMAFAVFQQTSMVDTTRTDWFFRKLAKLEESGGLSYRGRWTYLMERVPPLYRALENFGLDWAEIAVAGCRSRGIRPWIYFRMNDLHSVDDESSLFHDSFFYEAKEKGYLNGNPAYGHPLGTSGRVEYLYDFSHTEVREWLLSYLEEITLRYDVFGYELDFMRNIYCFDYLRAEPGYHEYMNDFLRRVKVILGKAEETHGHPIRLAVRLGQSVEHNLVYGFDVETWIKEGLVDMLIPSCEEVCNSGVDIPSWRRLIGDDVALAVGFDSHVIRWLVHEAAPLYAMRNDHLRGFASSYFHSGADGIYFNNYYSPDRIAKDLDRQTASEGHRTLVVTHQDIVPIGHTGYKPLPLAVNGEAVLNLGTGPIREGESVHVTVGYNAPEGNALTVLLNGSASISAEPVPIRPDRVEGHYYDSEWKFHQAETLTRSAFDVAPLNGEFAITLKGNGITVVYLDVSISPAEA